MTKLLKLLKGIKPNRIAVYLVSVAGLATGVAAVLADLDPTSAAGLIAGLLAIVKVVDTWLKGWQHHEASERYMAVTSQPEGVAPITVKP